MLYISIIFIEMYTEISIIILAMGIIFGASGDLYRTRSIRKNVLASKKESTGEKANEEEKKELTKIRPYNKACVLTIIMAMAAIGCAGFSIFQGMEEEQMQSSTFFF